MGWNRKRDPRSDATLVGICNEGDARAAADAFEALYRRHKDFVLRVALRFAPDVDTALDVLQDTFVQLLRRFPPTGEGLRLTAKMTTLLYPMARNAAFSAQRKASGLPVAGEVTPDELPAPAVREGEGIGRLLADLPAGQREALTLRFVDGLTLHYRDGWYSFVFPMVVGPRYNPPMPSPSPPFRAEAAPRPRTEPRWSTWRRTSGPPTTSVSACASTPE